MSFNVDALILAVRKLAEEYPDAVYPNRKCYYSTGECGPGEGCIVGQAAKIACPELYEIMRQRDQQAMTDISAILAPYNLPRIKLYWLSLVQSRQDHRQPWNKCITDADEFDYQFLNWE